MRDHAQAKQAAPVLAEQRGRPRLDCAAPLLQPADMARVGIEVDIVGLVAFAESDQIGRQHPEPGIDQQRNHLAIEKRPARFAVEQQHGGRIAWAFVDIVHACAKPIAEIGLEPVLGEGIVGNVGEPFGRCTQDLHRSLLSDDRYFRS